MGVYEFHTFKKQSSVKAGNLNQTQETSYW